MDREDKRELTSSFLFLGSPLDINISKNARSSHERPLKWNKEIFCLPFRKFDVEPLCEKKPAQIMFLFTITL